MGKARKQPVSRKDVMREVQRFAAAALRVSEDAAARNRHGEAAKFLAVAIFLRDVAESPFVWLQPDIGLGFRP